MRTPWKSAFGLAIGLLVVQLVAVLALWHEKFESGAALQVLPPSHLDFSEDVWNVETLRSLLESPDLEAEVRARFGLDPQQNWTARPLVERRFQEVDPVQGILRFRFRDSSPEVARGVVQALLDGMEARWRSAARSRTRFLLEQDAQVLDMNLEQFDRQLAVMPPYKTVLEVATGSPWAGLLPSFVGASPHFEDLRAQRLNLARRRAEIGIMLARPGGSPDPVPRWRVVAPPVTAQRPVWPSRRDLLVVSLVNALLWAGAWYLFQIWRPAPGQETQDPGSPSHPGHGTTA